MNRSVNRVKLNSSRETLNSSRFPSRAYTHARKVNMKRHLTPLTLEGLVEKCRKLYAYALARETR